MPKSVKVGSIWFVISMSWIQKWQSYVGFDELSKGETQKEHPGKIDNCDIIEPFAMSEG